MRKYWKMFRELGGFDRYCLKSHYHQQRRLTKQYFDGNLNTLMTIATIFFFKFMQISLKKIWGA